jgi:hypothetical protein
MSKRRAKRAYTVEEKLRILEEARLRNAKVQFGGGLRSHRRI